MPHVRFAAALLLPAVLCPSLFAQDAAPPPPDPPASPAEAAADRPADRPPGYEPADDRGTLKLPPTGGERRTADRADLAKTETRVTELTNAFRKKQGLGPLTRDKTLADTAAKFGRYLAEQGVLGHRAGGTTPSERVRAAGYEFCAVRENLAYEFDTFGFTADALAEACVTGWIDSPGHRANLLAADVTETGVGVVRDPASGRYFAVQLFALPASAAVSFEVENRTAAPQIYRVAGEEYTLPPRYVQSHTRCAPGAVTVRLGPAPPAADPAAGDGRTAESADPVELTDGQVLILRPTDAGGVEPDVWSPPAEGKNAKPGGDGR